MKKLKVRMNNKGYRDNGAESQYKSIYHPSSSGLIFIQRKSVVYTF